MLKYVISIFILLLAVNNIQAQTTENRNPQDTSQFTITDQGNHNYEYAKVSVYAKDKQNGLPMVALVGFRDQNGKVLANFFTDKSGFALVNLFDYSTIAFLTVDYIGYYAIKVPISRLKGKNSVIKVLLKGQDITHEGIH